MSVVTIIKEKVLGKLKGLKVDYLSGPDGLHPRILEEIAEEIVEALVVIVQESWESERVQEEWKVAHVTPLFKKEGRQKTGNYRPVSLTSILGRMLEGVQRRMTMKGLPFEEHLGSLGLYAMEFRSTWTAVVQEDSSPPPSQWQLGTNINDAIQTGSKLLKDYIAQQDKSVWAVSLIIFLTDGRPTIAEVQPHKILSNTRKAAEKKFCIFTLGIGRDVDYRLLQRMSLENCGVMRRINEDSDASILLKGFFDEIGTPLLSDIRVDYSEDSVEYVTQNFFPNYFNGSELIIAGKLTDNTSDNLHVQVAASTSDKHLMLEADVKINDTRRSSNDFKARSKDSKEHLLKKEKENSNGFKDI
eukprot:g46069.t1